ncbi:MAG: hypothetical protein KGN36_18910, partial [Acidobacteriota bacterium]|nr:hypothetical protein [Acidobacteriota bacterium]
MTSFAELRAAARDFLLRHAAGGVVIVAEHRQAADELAFEVCPGVLTGVERYGFREFVHRAARDAVRRRGLTAVSHLVREAIAARVAAATELTRLREAATFPGFPRALTDTLEDLRLNRRAAEGDLGLLAEAYDAELDARGFAGHALRVELARDAVGAADSPFRGKAIVLLDAAVRSAAERALAGAL